jgi:5-(carboxyamino)imidazole ribonucleotide synthase
MRLEKPLPPGSTIGILGGGQLGRMLALAAAQLGLKCHIYAPEKDSPAFQVAPEFTCASYDNSQDLAEFAQKCGVVTYEFENVPAETAKIIARHTPLAPGAHVLATSQDRLTEKTFLKGLGLATAPFAQVDDEQGLRAALGAIDRPAILKTRRLGYDGKGQFTIKHAADEGRAWSAVGKAPAILEGFVPFSRELSIIASRAWNGTVAVYDVPENEHENHILRRSTVPARIAPATAASARGIAAKITNALDYVGIIGVELFLVEGREGERLLVNEIAPRVHNSGHWTLDACVVSQFEQHIRAVAGWPLGSPERHSDVVMTNLIGDEAGDWLKLAAEPGTAIHLYGKAESRPGRKMGHINRLAPRQR